MVRNAIVRLCTLLVLVLLVSAVTSGWASPAAGSRYQARAKKGAMCGGIAGLKCPEGQACRYPTNMCNVADLSGTCVEGQEPLPEGRGEGVRLRRQDLRQRVRAAEGRRARGQQGRLQEAGCLTS